MKFNKDKYKVLHLGKHNPGLAARVEIFLGGEQLCEKGSGGPGGQQIQNE